MTSQGQLVTPPSLQTLLKYTFDGLVSGEHVFSGIAR